VDIEERTVDGSECVRAARKEESDMNPYAIVGSAVGSAEAASLRGRVMSWHDAMVAHERRLRSGHTADACDEECPHVEARALWAEVSAALGPRASELTFLRSRAQGASASSRIPAGAVSESSMDSPDPSRMATAEL
jgi:hypothetical protein